MEFNEYQKKALSTAVYPGLGCNWVYPLLGLCGEVGEIAEKLKKIIRDHGGVLQEPQREEILRELGDVMWYLATLSHELGFDLDTVATKNVEKLEDRMCRNKINGSGDFR